MKLELPNILMGGFALFSLKDSSLLEYGNRFKERKKNLKTVYGITQCPSDTAMREILDDVAPGNLQNIAGEYISLLRPVPLSLPPPHCCCGKSLMQW